MSPPAAYGGVTSVAMGAVTVLRWGSFIAVRHAITQPYFDLLDGPRRFILRSM